MTVVACRLVPAATLGLENNSQLVDAGCFARETGGDRPAVIALDRCVPCAHVPGPDLEPIPFTWTSVISGIDFTPECLPTP